MIFTNQPDEFHPVFEVVGSFCEFDKRILLLLRQDSRPQGNTWGIPSGKIDGSESLLAAIQRELYEETNIEVNDKAISYIEKVYVKYPTYDFIYHMFKTEFVKEPVVIINKDEHKAFQWIHPEDAIQLENQIEDLDACIKLVY
jgi:8-oxo-dGTP pyrophosphatase MutT (NUDIX family)